MKTTRILLDMDGVIADFFTAALDRCNLTHFGPPVTVESYRAIGTYDMEKAFGISRADFWCRVDSPGFWLGIKPYPYAAGLVDFLESLDLPWFISSSPSLAPHCIPEKLEWLKRHFGLGVTDCMFGSAKYLMSRPGALLIDDLPRNCELFTEEGGDALCVPSNWNTADVTLDLLTNMIQGKLL